MINCTVATDIGCQRLIGDLNACNGTYTTLEIIEGNVLCELGSQPETILPALTTILGNVLFDGSSLTKIAMPLLLTVLGTISIQNNTLLQMINLPQLQNVTQVTVAHNSALSNMDLSNLVAVQSSFSMNQNPSLTGLLLPKLVSVDGNFTIAGVRDPLVLALPMLHSVANLFISNTSISQFDAPNLQIIENSLNCVDNSALPRFALPSLNSSVNNVFIERNRVLTEIVLPLTSVNGSLGCTGNDLLVTVSMNSLAFIGATLILTQNPMITSFSLPALRQVVAEIIVLQNLRLSSFNVSLQLPLVSLVVQNNNALTTLAMDLLPAISAVFAVDSNLNLLTLSFDKLTSIGQGLDLKDNPKLDDLSFRLLQSVGSVVISKCAPGSVSMPALVTIGAYFRLQENSLLRDIDMDNLRSIGESFTVTNNPQLAALDFPALAKVGSLFEVVNNALLATVSLDTLNSVRDALKILDHPKLRKVKLPLLETVDALDISRNVYLDILVVPTLKTIADFLQLVGNNQLETASFGTLTTIGNNFRIQSNPILREVSLPGLSKIGRQFEIFDNGELRTVSVPLMTSIGRYLEFKTVQLDNISMPLLSSIADYLYIEGNIQSVDLVSLKKIGSSRKFQLSANGNVSACWSVIKQTPGWESIVIDPRAPDVCRQTHQTRTERGGNFVSCPPQGNCSWQSVGCYPSLTVLGGHLDCSDARLKGPLSLHNINWTNLPSFMTTLASIDLGNNSISEILGGGLTCPNGMNNLKLVTARGNPPLSFVHEQFASQCPNIKIEHDLRECRHSSDVDMTLTEVRGSLVCRCANGTFCTDDGWVLRCSHQEYLARNECIACPFGATSAPKAISPAECTKGGQTIDTLGIWISVACLSAAIIYAVLVKVRFRKRYPSNNIRWWAPLVVLLSLYDFFTDCLFLAQTIKGEHRSLVYWCAIFLSLPILLNLMCLVALFVFEFANKHEVEDESHDFRLWFSKTNRAFVSAMFLFGLTSPSCVLLLESRIFGLETLSAPFKARTFLKFHPLVNNFAEDIPQLCLQIYSMSLQSELSIITALSVTASIMTLLTGLVSRVLFGCMVSMRNDRSGSVAMQQRHLSTKLLESSRERADTKLQRSTM